MFIGHPNTVLYYMDILVYWISIQKYLNLKTKKDEVCILIAKLRQFSNSLKEHINTKWETLKICTLQNVVLTANEN